MTPTLEQEVLKLSPEQRLWLIQFLAQSLREEDLGAGELSLEQKAELDRRSQSIIDGTAEYMSWQEVKKSITG